MSFTSGRSTFCRFRVTGDAASAVDEAFLSLLAESRFQESPIVSADDVEVGFVTGEHLLDTRFTREKIAFGESGRRALFAIRIDTHKVPAEIKRAEIQINQQSAAEGNPTGFASKSEKRHAREVANNALRERAAKGEFRRSKMVELLWDLKTRTLYCGACGGAVIEQLARLMRQAFAVELDYLSGGVLAGEFLKAAGRTRDWEDMRPSVFTDAPVRKGGGEPAGDDVVLPWIAKSIDLKDYLGNEFLIWLWWNELAGEDGPISTQEGDYYVALESGLDMTCAWGVTGKQSLRAELSHRLPEAAEALREGKWPRKAGLIVADDADQWAVALQADQMAFNGALLPKIDDADTPRNVIQKRLDLIVGLSDAIDALYRRFLSIRTSPSWSTRQREIRNWIKQLKPASAAA